ncbi:MAG: terminase [Acidobacteriaceae bacterium]
MEALLGVGRMMEKERSATVQIAAQWLKVRDRQGRFRRLVANDAQRAFEAGRGRQNIVLKARQMGMTTWIAGRFFLRTITAQGVLSVQVAQNRKAVESIFGIVQRMWENLPRELREGPLARSRANVGQMVFPELDSEFRVWSAGDENAGRGLSIQNLHCSEVSRWPGDAAATLAGLRAALAPGGELVLESTPNGAYGAFYEEWGRGVDAVVDTDFDAMESKDERGGRGGNAEGAEENISGLGPSGLVRHFFPWWMELAYVGAGVARESMSAEECVLVEAHGLSAEQIGFRRGLERSFGGLRSQEFAEDAETCFRATGDCCFDVEAIEARLAEVAGTRNAGGLPLRLAQGQDDDEKQTTAVGSRRGGTLLVWMPALAGKDYIVAVDTAGGGAGGDFAAVQVIDAATGMQCAELQERLAPLELASVAAELAREYGGALVAVERNNHGSAVLAYLATVERYERVYRQAGQPGWLTTTASKPEMVSGLGALLVERPQMFMSRRLLAECRTFVRGENGRSGAANGTHDDLVMSMGLAQAVRAERLLRG